MDDRTVYLEVRQKMKDLLAHINARAATPFGACFEDGTCRMTTAENCHGRFFGGVECLVEGDDDDTARAAEGIVDRMGQLLKYIHAESNASDVHTCTLDAGGQTFSLEMTPQECEVVGGVGHLNKANARAGGSPARS
jgi:hypothetical protein